MDELTYDSDVLTRYLLGDLPPAQQESLEEKFFTENDLFIELLDAEDHLIGDYLSDRLSSDDRERFERHFLTLPDLRREVEIAHFFRNQASAQIQTEPSRKNYRERAWWSILPAALGAKLLMIGAAAATVIVAVIGVWPVARPYWQQSPNRGAANSTGPMRSAVVSIELSPGQTRSAGQATVAVKAASTRAIDLKLAAGSTAFSNYRGKLERLEVEAIEVTTSTALKWEQTDIGERVVTWEIPTEKLSSGEYQVKLDGINADNSFESIGTYHFKLAVE